MGDITACQIQVRPPEHIVADWNHLLYKSNSKVHTIPSIFDVKEWKPYQLYNVRIGYIYNPSKFWIVREEQELDYFHRYLCSFYNRFKEHYQLQPHYLKLNMYCITFTENGYYRSVLLSYPHESSVVTVFLIDFGYIARVPLDKIYFMTIKMYGVPRFAVRACLAGIGPVESTTWTTEATAKFSALVNNQLLKAQVRNVDAVTKTVFVHLGIKNYENLFMEDLTDKLVRDNVIRKLTSMELKDIKFETKKNRPKTRSKIEGKVKIKFLWPTFTSLENGLCTENVLSLNHINLSRKRVT